MPSINASILKSKSSEQVGVLTGRDAFEHILCGASMVQVGTTLHKEGIGAFDRITNELKEIMSEKGYERLEDFRGKLRYID